MITLQLTFPDDATEQAFVNALADSFGFAPGQGVTKAQFVRQKSKALLLQRALQNIQSAGAAAAKNSIKSAFDQVTVN